MKTQKTQQLHKIEMEKCAFSGKKIMKPVKKNGKIINWRRLKSFRTFYIKMSNGSKLKMQHHESVEMTKENQKLFLEEMKKSWIAGLKNTRKERIERAIKHEKQAMAYALDEFSKITIK